VKIITAVFSYIGQNKYERCLRALTHSIERTNPDADFQVLRLQPPAPVEGAYQGWVSNHIKLKAYAEQELNDNTIFVDADTVFLREAAFLFDKEFDVAIGRRTGGRVLYNGGVVLFKPTDKAKEFLESWSMADNSMLYDQEFHQKWRKKYNGQNQASFGFLVEAYPDYVRLHEYPTSLVNAVEQDWPVLHKIDPVIVHVRKKLLEYAVSDFTIDQIPKKLRVAVKLWRDLEKDE